MKNLYLCTTVGGESEKTKAIVLEETHGMGDLRMRAVTQLFPGWECSGDVKVKGEKNLYCFTEPDQSKAEALREFEAGNCAAVLFTPIVLNQYFEI